MAGRVKSRLQPLLGAQGAARLHARLTRRALATARAANCGEVELCCAPHRKHAFFARCVREFGVSLSAQRGADLGERMHGALQRGLRSHARVMLMGSDCPALTPARLRAAARALRAGADAVFAPAEDGGYALVGVTQVSTLLFKGVEWGSPAVMAQTRARLRMLGWRWRETGRVWDVDRPEDYVRLVKSRLLDRTP